MISLYGKQYEWFQRKVKKGHLIRQGCIVSFLGNYTKQDNKLVALYLNFLMEEIQYSAFTSSLFMNTEISSVCLKALEFTDFSNSWNIDLFLFLF